LAQSKRSPEELTTDEAKRFIEDAASFSRPILVFSGGEALLRQDLFELIAYADKLGLKPTLATNASLVSREAGRKLSEAGAKMVAVSIYGSTDKAHDEFCGQAGAFKKSLAGVNNLRSAGLPLQINTTITERNLSELEAIGNFAIRQGAQAYHVFFLVPVGRGTAIAGDEISPKEYEDTFNRLYDFKSGLTAHMRIKATCAPHYYRVARQRMAKEGKKTAQGKDDFAMMTKGCLAGQAVCFISYKGEVFGCGYLPIKAGDLREQDFKTIWFESELFKSLRDDSKLLGKCGTCEFKKVCGGCRARAYSATGDYLSEEPYCVYQPLRPTFNPA
jgi:radical SAM protein with 4Fe4S-binding SPASM domain